MPRWGGFRRGRRRYIDDWEELKAPSAFREETVAATPQEFSYVEAQGIWNLRSTMQFPKANAASPPPESSNATVNYISHLQQNTSSTSYSFSVSFGVGFSSRIAVVVVHNEIGGAAGTTPAAATQVTIGGVSATKASEANTEGVSATHTSIWYAVVSSGTQTVSVQYSLAPIRMSLGSYLVQNYFSATPVFTEASDTPATPSSRTIQVPALGSGSVVISGNTSGDIYSHTWSGLTENYDSRIVTGLTGATGASIKTSSGDAFSVTATPEGTPAQPTSMVLAVWS
jgi:hypothetical protein